MHFTCRSFLGSHNSLNWSQYWENEPDDALVVQSKGHLFGLINLSLGSPSEDLSTIGRRLIEDISQKYFYDDQTNVPESLRSVARYLSSSESLDQISLSVILGVIHQGRLTLMVLNGGHVILSRNRKIGEIIAGKNEGHILTSGPSQTNDKIIFATHNFFQKIGWDKIKSLVAEDNLQNLEENILSEIYSLDSQSGVGAAFIRIDEDILTQEVKVEPATSDSPIITPPPVNIFKKVFTHKPVFISPSQIKEVSRRRHLNIIISVIILLGLFTSAFIGKKKSDAAHVEAQYQELKSQLQDKLDNAKAVKNLNIDSALALAKQAKEISKEMIALRVHSPESNQLSKLVDSLLIQTGSSDIYAPPMFYDTSIITSSPKYQKISLLGSNLYLLDPTAGRVDSVDVTQKSTKNISLNDKLKTALGLTQIDANVYVFTQDGIYQVSKSSIDLKTSFSDISQPVTPVSLASWNGALYLLDSNAPTIIKFTPNNTGFGKGASWLKDGQVVSQNPTSLAINGKIWVLAGGGLITPYVRGVKDNYHTPSNPVKSAKSLVTTPDGETLAFIDSDNLIYVYKKNGENSAKYNLGTNKVLDLAMDSTSTTLYLLCSDQKIYKITL